MCCHVGRCSLHTLGDLFPETSLRLCSCWPRMLAAHLLSAVISDSPAQCFLWHFHFLRVLCEQSISKHENGFLLHGQQSSVCLTILTDMLSDALLLCVPLYVDLYVLHMEAIWKVIKKKLTLCADSQWSVAGLDTAGTHESQMCQANTMERERQQCSPWEKMKCGQTYNKCFVWLCQSLVLFIDQMGLTVDTGWDGFSQVTSRKMRRVTAGVEDQEIRAVYVLCPIRLHWVVFSRALGEKRRCPLPRSLCFWSINKSHSRSGQQPCLFAQCVCSGLAWCVSCAGSLRNIIKWNMLRLMLTWQQLKTETKYLTACT